MTDNMSTLHILCQAPDLIFLSTLINANPNLFANELFITALCRTVTTGGGVFSGPRENINSLYHLCNVSAGLQLLEKLIDVNPKVFATDGFAKALTQPLSKEDGALNSTNVLTLLKKSEEGEALLAKLSKINPELFSKLLLEDQENREQGNKEMRFFQPAAVDHVSHNPRRIVHLPLVCDQSFSIGLVLDLIPNKRFI